MKTFTIIVEDHSNNDAFPKSDTVVVYTKGDEYNGIVVSGKDLKSALHELLISIEVARLHNQTKSE